jgi:hypothetical protein
MEFEKKEIDNLKNLLKFDEEIFSSKRNLLLYKYYLLKNYNKLLIQPGKILKLLF